MQRKRRFAKMYEAYADDIFRFLMVHMRDQQLAEDLTADTFTRAWKNIDKFDFKNSRAWLYKIAQNTMIDYWRKHKPESIEDESLIVDERVSVEEQTDQTLTKERIHAALGNLPPEMRSVVALRFLQGYSAKQTAESLGLSEANVRVIQFRALKELKAYLS